MKRHNIVTLLTTLAVSLMIVACDGKPAKPKIKNPLAGQMEALDKAKAVEQQLNDAFEKQRKAIDAN